MPWNLLILPLLGGFLFCHRCHFLRFSFQRTDGYRLLFVAATWGLFFAVAGRVVTLAISGMGSRGEWVESVWTPIAPFPYSGAAMIALLLGLLTPYPLNRFVYPKKKAIARAMERSADDLTVLLYTAAEANVPVCITLDSRKVYVGYVVNAPNLEQDKTSLALLPLRSGYRAPDSLAIRFEVFYEALYIEGAIDLGKFCVVMPLSRIGSASYYDPSVYERHFRDATADIGIAEVASATDETAAEADRESAEN